MCEIQVNCKGCNKTPDELEEYVRLADVCGFRSPTQAVQVGEGTYNRMTGKFYCTECYIEAGMPLGKA